MADITGGMYLSVDVLDHRSMFCEGNTQIADSDNFMLQNTESHYVKASLCVDTSGSMSWNLFILQSGMLCSRLDVVKAELGDVFCSKLSKYHFFSILQCNHNAYVWDNLLLQATPNNLQKA